MLFNRVNGKYQVMLDLITTIEPQIRQSPPSHEVLGNLRTLLSKVEGHQIGEPQQIQRLTVLLADLDPPGNSSTQGPFASQ